MGDKIFQLDNPFWNFMGRAADYVVLNLLFLLTCLPVFTIGAALSGLHRTIEKMAEDTEGNLARTYIRTCIRSFRTATPTWLVLLGTGALLYFDLSYTISSIDSSFLLILLPVLGGMLFLWLMLFSWSFVLPEDSSLRLCKRLRRGLQLSICHFPYTMLMILIEILPFVIYKMSMQLFAGIAMPVYMLAGLSLSGLACNRIAWHATGRTRETNPSF